MLSLQRQTIIIMYRIEYLFDKERRKMWYRAFRMWQRRPHEVKPLSENQHACASCGTLYQGNYCPRCGQSAVVGRFSFKKALLLFLDVWGIGNRGMFRSIMFRPGYMIHDYLGGMQSAYFPPFKMFFLLTALSLLIEHGVDFGVEEKEADAKQNLVETIKEKKGLSDAKADSIASLLQEKIAEKESHDSGVYKNGKKVDNQYVNDGLSFMKFMNGLRKKNPAIFSLFTLLLVSVPLYFLFFRRSPAVQDLRYSEFFVALVYVSNVYTLYAIIGKLIWPVSIIAYWMVFVALKQFSGFTKRRVLAYFALTFVAVLLALIFVGVVFSLCAGLLSNLKTAA